MKKWIGNWIIGTSVIHTLFAILMFQDTWLQILNNGIFNTVGQDSQIGAVVFFFLWGLLYFVLGFTVQYLENNKIILPQILGFGLLINAIVSVILIPESGYWLMFPPAVAIIMSKKTKNDN